MAESSGSLDAKHAAGALRQLGWVGFWVQLVLLVFSAVILLFAIADPGFNINFRSIFRLLPTLGSLAALSFAVFWNWHYVAIARDMRSHNPRLHHGRAQVSQSLERGVTTNLISLALTLIAAQSVISALTVKTLSTPAGIAVTDVNRLIQPLDVFVVQSCLLLIFAGVVGIAISFRLLRQIHPA